MPANNEVVEIAKYQFHPWARKGIAANIIEPDDLGAGTANHPERAEVPIGVILNGNALTKNFSLIAPGDIIGINRDMIIRTDPLNQIASTEPNYLAFMEFYDEDFTWRYTPAKVVGEKLRPWIFLLVLKDGEFTRGAQQLPMPVITITNKDALPPVNEIWMWAHVHSDADIPDSDLNSLEKFLLTLNKSRNDDPDQLYSRLMSPRRLDANTAYYAFLIPAFETGRMAGLKTDADLSAVPAQKASWTDAGANGDMPVYFEWSFRTGEDADFESMVKLLMPNPLDPKVGIRDMDCLHPGFVRADDPTKEIPGTSPDILGLEGALKSPTAKSTVFPDPPASRDFDVELQKIANLPATLAADLTKDPIISVPIYGSNHAKKSATDVVLLDTGSNTWVNDLNRDPRTRVPAGFGTLVIQKNQENYMQKAWDQVTTIFNANKIIIATFFNMKVAIGYTVKTFNKLATSSLLAVSKPILSRVMGSPTTIQQQLNDSILPSAVFKGTFRRLIRPNGKFVAKFKKTGSLNYDNLVTQINNGKITAAPPKQIPAALPDTKEFADQIFSASLPPWLLWLINNSKLILIILFILFVVLAIVTGAFVLFAVLEVAAFVAYQRATSVKNDVAAAGTLLDPKKELEALKAAPQQPDFTLVLSDEATTPAPTPTSAGADSVEARNFRSASIDLTTRLAVLIPDKIYTAFNISNAQEKITAAIQPQFSFVRQLIGNVVFPGYVPITEPEKMFPAMAYPDFEDPMYRKLNDISSELLLPNVKLIPPNTISLLKTNQKFIEAYMVGLNHEMGRELLWREYLTDERGSYFRQFWDVKGIIRPVDGKTDAETTEAYKDIPPLDTWLRSSLLGMHNKRSATGAGDQAVLVVRADLLYRYPNTAIYAQKALPGNGGPNDPRIEQNLTNDQFATQIKFPLYQGEIPPDIKFFGFDLTIEQSKGTDISPDFPGDHLGWFFIIQQAPGQPRFGMDITFDPGSDGLSWDDLSWTNFPSAPAFIRGSEHPTIHPPLDNYWGADSARMAYVLFQAPSMVAVHASEMLANLSV
jgi:hypothetical protein